MYGVLHTEMNVYTFLTPSEQLFKYKCPGGVIFLPSKQIWAILSVLVSLTDTLASDTKYRYQWFSSIDTSVIILFEVKKGTLMLKKGIFKSKRGLKLCL